MTAIFPARLRSTSHDHKIKLYTINGTKLGIESGMGPTRINTILQSAFFKLTGIIPEEKAIELMKAAAKKTYGLKGDDVVQKNWNAIDLGATGVVEVNVPDSWANGKDEGLDYPKATKGSKEVQDFVNNIQIPVSSQEGNSIPVSVTMTYTDGSTPSGTAAFEKRGVSVAVPVWNPDTCIECQQCSYVCPHAAIRSVALTDEEAAKAPEGMQLKELTGMPGYKFSIVVSQMDCLGCGSCANVCPANKAPKNVEAGVKTLAMQTLDDELKAQQKYFDYAVELDPKQEVVDKFGLDTVKGSQFKQPYLEFSGACAGCGETPYAKLVTQLYGDRMYIANATGCSSIWGNSSPSTPYTTNKKGQGPAWANSLFEDNAEFGFGMYLAQKTLRGNVKDEVEALAAETSDANIKAAIDEYLATFDETLQILKLQTSFLQLSQMTPAHMLRRSSRTRITLLRSHSGSSVVTDGHSISDSVVSTTYLLPVRM